MYYTLLVYMAGPNNTGQQIVTHLFCHLLPIIIFNLAYLAIPREQASLHTVVVAFTIQQHGTSRGVLVVYVKRESRDTRSLSELIKKTTTHQI